MTERTYVPTTDTLTGDNGNGRSVLATPPAVAPETPGGSVNTVHDTRALYQLEDGR